MGIVNWLIERLREPSTWRGITTLLGVIGVTLSPEQWAAISAAVIGLLGVIEVFRKEVK